MMMTMKTMMTTLLLFRSKVVAINVEKPSHEGPKEELGLNNISLKIDLIVITATNMYHHRWFSDSYSSHPNSQIRICSKNHVLGLCLAGPLWKSNSGKSVGKPSSFQNLNFRRFLNISSKISENFSWRRTLSKPYTVPFHSASIYITLFRVPLTL